MAKKSKFKYKKRDKSQVEKRANQSAYPDQDNYLKDEVKLFTPKEGDNCLRILPPTWENAEHYGLDIHLHYQVGANKNTYVCPEAMKGDPCPICEEKRRAEADGDDDYAKSLRSSKRTLVYAVDRDSDDDDLGALRAWPMSWTMDKDISNLSIDKRTGETYDVDDPEDGYDVEFTREGKGLKTKYTGMAIARRTSELDNDDAMEFAVQNPIDTMLIYYDFDHLAKQVASGGGDDGKDDKKRGKSKGEDRDSKSNDSEYEYDDIMDAEFDDLVDMVENEDLDVDPNDYDEDKSKSVRKFAKAIAKELGVKDD